MLGFGYRDLIPTKFSSLSGDVEGPHRSITGPGPESLGAPETRLGAPETR